MEAKDTQAKASNAADRGNKSDRVDNIDRVNRVSKVLKVNKVSKDATTQHAKHGWEVKKLEEVAFKLFAGGDKPKVFSENQTETLNIPVYANGTSMGGLVGYTNKAIVDKECVTISARGTIGFCCVRKFPFVPIVRLITIIPTQEIKTEYLSYALSNATFENNGVAIPQLTIPMIKDSPIPVPSREEQERIVEELDCLSGVIEKKREQLKQLDALAQSIFYNMFGDPIINEKGWEVKKLIDVVKMQRGFDLPVQDRDNNGIIPIFGSNGIIGYHSSHKAEYGIITGRSGTLGEVYSYDKPFWPLNTTLFSVNTHGNNIIFLKFLIGNFHLERFKAGAGVPTLNRNEFHNEIIPNIPLALQLEFAEKIEAIEKQKELLKRSIKEVETLFDARMDYYFGDT